MDIEKDDFDEFLTESKGDETYFTGSEHDCNTTLKTFSPHKLYWDDWSFSNPRQMTTEEQKICSAYIKDWCSLNTSSVEMIGTQIVWKWDEHARRKLSDLIKRFKDFQHKYGN